MKSDHRSIWLILAGLPLSFIVNRFIKTPIIVTIAAWTGIPLKLSPGVPLWFICLIWLNAPIFEEAIKIFPAVLLPRGRFLGGASEALGDVNHDGRLDIVSTGERGEDVFVFMGLGDATFAPAVRYPLSKWMKCVALGDLNGDLTLVNSTFTNNAATGTDGNPGHGGCGGAIYMDGSASMEPQYGPRGVLAKLFPAPGEFDAFIARMVREQASDDSDNETG